MYICLCNALTDRAINKAVQSTSCTVSDVYRALGCAPKCGKCVPMVRDMLNAMDLPASEGDKAA